MSPNFLPVCVSKLGLATIPFLGLFRQELRKALETEMGWRIVNFETYRSARRLIENSTLRVNHRVEPHKSIFLLITKKYRKCVVFELRYSPSCVWLHSLASKSKYFQTGAIINVTCGDRHQATRIRSPQWYRTRWTSASLPMHQSWFNPSVLSIVPPRRLLGLVQ